MSADGPCEREAERIEDSEARAFAELMIELDAEIDWASEEISDDAPTIVAVLCTPADLAAISREQLIAHALALSPDGLPESWPDHRTVRTTRWER
jgi:hypothetical protein